MENYAVEDIHPHCLNCIKFKKCNVKCQQGVSCGIICCPLNCGMLFHACKKTEHLLLCPNEKVSCYNAESGCPCKMPRKNLGKHLITCPASVVHCTMEWNRWRLDASNKEKLLLYTNAKKSQQRPLDIALALRDQRMLKWHTSSDHLQKTIRTDFWYYPQRIYPVKPSTSVQGRGQDGSNGITIAKVMCNESGEISSHKQPSSSNSCKMQTTSESKSPNNHACSGTEIISNGHCSDENKENVATLVNHAEVDCSSIPKINASCTRSVIVKGNEEVKRNELNGCDNWKKMSSENLSNESDFDENFVNAILSCPTRYLGLGPCIESPEKNYVYTFLCSQEFRRDEYPWHYKNVHSDIHGGLNGWLQERCPLAQYGCTFSRQQLNPLPKGSRIVYNEILESFGISPPPHQEGGSNASSHGSYSVNFFDLPFEVLQHIARFLDSFSLSNLSHTCQLMQAVCQSLLVERGIVTIHWEVKKENGVIKWEDTGKKWCFSSHFTPVHDWTFDEGSSMSNHLKSCKFYNRIKKTEPYLLPMGEPCWKLFEKLNQSALNWTSENLMTKL